MRAAATIDPVRNTASYSPRVTYRKVFGRPYS
jgi:hypothetical protein